MRTELSKAIFFLSGALLLLSTNLVTEVPTMERRPGKLMPASEFALPDTHVVRGIFFSPDSRYLVSTGYHRVTRQGIIDFWDVNTRELVRSLKLPDEVSTAAFTPDGKRLLAASWDNYLYIFAAPDWETEHRFAHDPPKRTAQHLAMLNNNWFLTAHSGRQGLRLWSLRARQPNPLATPENDGVIVLGASKDGKRFATGYLRLSYLVEVWDADRLKVIGRLELAKNEQRQGVFDSIAFSPDGKWIATGCRGTTTDPPDDTPQTRLVLIVWDAATLKPHWEKRNEGLEFVPYALDFTSDSKLLVCSTGVLCNVPGRLSIWEVETGKLLYSVNPSKHGCIRQALSPDGQWLVINTADGALLLFDFAKIRREIGK